MRLTVSLCLALGLVVGAASAFAQEAAKTPPAAPEVKVEDCAADPSRLGLSRVVEIDTTNGPHFGGMHGGNNAFLEDGEVVLTFDDGPSPSHTRKILAALAAHCTKATFFMVGRMAAADPAMVREVAVAGHTIGSHTWSHKNLGVLAFPRSRKEVETAISTITAANRAPISPFFRFPYLSDSKSVDAYLKERNVANIWIDVDSKDYLTRDPKLVIRRIMAQLATKHKGIILMHDIQLSTSRAIDTLLDTLHEQGYKVVHIVAKSQLQTLPEFDEDAKKLIAAREANGSASVASRESEGAPPPAQAPAIAGDVKGKTAATPGAKRPAKDSSLPWTAQSSAKKPAREPEQLPWQNILRQ